MATFEAILLLLLGAVAVTALARRLNAPFPVFLALAGAGLALAPLDARSGWTPSWRWPCSSRPCCSTPPTTPPCATCAPTGGR